MVDDQPDAAPASAETGRPKRPPPTIDLEATEIPREPAETSAATADADGDASRPKSNADAPANGDGVSAAARPSQAATAVIAALVGALAACGMIGAAAWAGWPATPAASDAATIDGLTKRLAALEARPAPSPSAAPDAPLAPRLDGLEKSAAALRGDVAALQSQMGQMNAAIGELKAAPRETTAAVDLTTITNRLGQLENATRTLSAEAKQQQAAPVDDKLLRRVVAVTLLDRLVRQGDSYVAALAAAKPLVPQPEALAPLEHFAASGVPSANTLSKDLLTRIASITPPEPQPAEGSGILERLQAGAERLVRIRRIETPAGESRSAVIRQAAAAARHDDVATAQRELSTLSGADRAPFESWIALVDARHAALTASRQLATDAVAALGKPAP